MSANQPSKDATGLPTAPVLLLCLLLLGAGYVVAIVRGPTPAQEMRVVTYPPPAPAPETATE